MPTSTSGPKVELDPVPPEEARQIDNIADLTLKQLERRYKDKPLFLRGVHPKDHGCVEATFTVSENLPAEYRVGLFKTPGKKFRAAIRFSNAAPLVTPDSPQELGPDNKPAVGPDGKPMFGHGSRGMAIKVYKVSGDRLVPDDGERTQDFLMINQPVFAFANVEDYEALSQVILDHKEDARPFFARLGPPFNDAVRMRADTSRKIIGRIKSLTFPQFAFQPPPLSPLDNRYFSASPFLFGEGRAMKFSAKPVNPVAGELGEAISEPDYLRNAMRKRMAAADGKDICFDFQVQVRSAESLAGKIETDIEDMCTLWDEAVHPFVTVARITIPPQDVASKQRQEFCEKLVYTPWHGLRDHRPLGGINRMRRKVYEVSAERRGCPVSPDLPPPKGQGGLLGFLRGLFGLKG